MDATPTQPTQPTQPAQTVPAPPPQDGFHIQRMGVEEGPYTFADLHAQIAARYITADTLVRRPGSGWFRASEIPGLFSDKEWLTALLLSLFVGVLGIDRFYLGYIGLGILKLITFGGCGIWALIDIILIAMDNVKDARGLRLRR
jgi:hypothetical protein